MTPDTSTETGIITLNAYSSAWLDHIAGADGAGLAAGMRYRVPADPAGTGCTVDGREWDDFSRQLTRLHLRGDYRTTIDGWDHYELVQQ